MKEILNFLALLREHNNREWFNAHKAEYLNIKAAADNLADNLIAGIASFDDSVAGLSVKDCTYRIYRDTRFSPDKRPYKTHIGIYVAQGGKKSGYAGYYLHLEPASEDGTGGCMLASGLYCPQPVELKSVREDIAYNGDEFHASLVQAKGFDLNRDTALKRLPLGFSADTPYAEYLKQRDFVLEHRLSDATVSEPDFLPQCIELFSRTRRFVAQLNMAVAYAHEEMM